MTKKLGVAVAVAVAIVAFFALGLHRYFSLEFFRGQREALESHVTASPLAAGFAFFAIYVVVAALSIPGAGFLTLVAGALFGLLWGTVIVSFASTIGATLAMLAARFVLRDWVQQKFGERIESINAGVERDGAFYLFALRLVIGVPFFVVNLLMGLTRIPARTFYWVSQVGMLPGTIVYVYAGSQLGEFRVTWQLLAALALLGIFPLLAKKALERIRARRIYARWQRPSRFDRNLVVIGGGAAGLVSAYVAAAAKAKVTLIEEHRMGGDCLNTGCVPSKALNRTARLASDVRRASELGVARAEVQMSFTDAMSRVQRVIAAIEPHDSAERYEALGVECLKGRACIKNPWQVDVELADGDVRTLTTRSIVIAAGARPFVPPIPGLAQAAPLTSDTVWNLRELPKRLVVLGGGPIGCELAQCFARFGSAVTQVEMLPRLLVREDPEVSEVIAKRFAAEGIDVRVGHKAKAVIVADQEKVLVTEAAGGEYRIAFDAILCAVGRTPRIEGYGLDTLGIPLTRSKTIQTNEHLQTVYPNIYACGDVAGPYQFTHTASHQAWYAATNALFGAFKRFRADYSVVPWATFTDPEVARVGLNETEAEEKKIDHEITTYALDDLDRAITDEEGVGFVKVLTAKGSDKILGVTIVGSHAAEMLPEFILAMRQRIGLKKILGTIHVYPTFSEANKYAAGAWQRNHLPQKALELARRYHAWMRA